MKLAAARGARRGRRADSLTPTTSCRRRSTRGSRRPSPPRWPPRPRRDGVGRHLTPSGAGSGRRRADGSPGAGAVELGPHARPAGAPPRPVVGRQRERQPQEPLQRAVDAEPRAGHDRCTPACAASSVSGVDSGASSSTHSDRPPGGVGDPPVRQLRGQRGEQRVALRRAAVATPGPTISSSWSNTASADQLVEHRRRPCRCWPRSAAEPADQLGRSRGPSRSAARPRPAWTASRS